MEAGWAAWAADRAAGSGLSVKRNSDPPASRRRELVGIVLRAGDIVRNRIIQLSAVSTIVMQAIIAAANIRTKMFTANVRLNIGRHGHPSDAGIAAKRRN
ncbi:hypothetical protein HUK84_19430 [Nguyenibacter vanlangensis]|uniref:Uncharacterized protein n=1 Tax=Nguyenibacter vanlangensis TaxID=1216886 RepID=A0A7Y7J003_9PROT|nr:hypothetical protein [Nguyenibacter vanlangensis]